MNANYFSHDSNARNDEKMLAVRMRLGAEGYGIYFMIIERMRDEADYTSIKDYNSLAFDFRVASDKVKSVVEDFDLFTTTEDGKRFYSESFIKRMELKDEKTKKRSDAGKIGMEHRWKNNNVTKTDNNVITMLGENITSKVKERKEKESKENNKEKEEREEKKIHTPKTFSLEISEVENFLINEQRWMEETVCMRHHISVEMAKDYIHEFVETLKDRAEETKTPKDAKQHFINWLKKQKEKQNDTAAKNRNDNSKEYRDQYLMQKYQTIVGKSAEV